MKKIILAVIAFAAINCVSYATEEFGFGVWFDCPQGIERQNIEGIGLGLPVISCGDLEGASLALCGNKGKKVSGFQGAWFGFNYAKSLYGIQLAFVNIQKGQHDDFALQLGTYNQAAENGVQIGFINNGQNNATFQLGLININKNGFLPVMIFVNFGKDLFD